MIVREIQAERIISATKIQLADYVINHYTGCQYSCLYCYARYLKRTRKRNENWGEYVDVKVNAVQLLKKELPAIKKGRVMIGSISESYQPIEKKYGLTAEILDTLHKFGIEEIVLLTRSDLILRDIELLKKFKKSTIFFTISGKDPLIKRFENNTPSYEKRINAIISLIENSINVWTHLGPIIPYFLDPLEIIGDLKDKAGKIEFESLNATTAPLDAIVENLKNIDNAKAEMLRSLYSNTDDYKIFWIEEKRKILETAKKMNIKTFFSFPALNEYF